MFDIGVTNTLCRRGKIQAKSELFGKAFEHFILLEMRAYLSYFRKNLSMYYWRSVSQAKVDLIIDNKVAIEIKSHSLIQDKHLKNLRLLKEEQLIKKYIVVSFDKHERITQDKIHILHWESFLKQLWNGKII